MTKVDGLLLVLGLGADLLAGLVGARIGWWISERERRRYEELQFNLWYLEFIAPRLQNQEQENDEPRDQGTVADEAQGS